MGAWPKPTRIEQQVPLLGADTSTLPACSTGARHAPGWQQPGSRSAERAWPLARPRP